MWRDWLTIAFGRNEWSCIGGTLEFGKFFFPICTFIAARFEHIIPQGIRGDRITFLAQMEAIQWHIAHIMVAIRFLWEFDVSQKWLIDDGKIIAMEFVHIGNTFVHILPLFHDFQIAWYLAGMLCTKHAWTFKVMRCFALIWFATHIFNYAHTCGCIGRTFVWLGIK